MILPIDLNKTKELKTYFEQMDIDAIKAFLPDGITYQDFSKVEFINRLKTVFKKFKKHGDTYLIPILGKCNGCYKNHSGFILAGNKSSNFITLIIYEQDGVIKDVKECANFKQETVLCKLNKQFFIDDMTGWIIAASNPEM